MDQYLINDSNNAKPEERSRLAASFKSATHKNHRVLYTLSGGKKDMSPTDRIYSKSYLEPPPSSPLRNKGKQLDAVEEPALAKADDGDSSPPKCKPSRAPKTKRRTSMLGSADDHTTLSILLVECTQKVFEIVSVNHTTQETTVGDVLSKARVQATDPLLSEQSYISLCNQSHELAAPMLPVHLMVQLAKSKYKGNDSDNKSSKKKKKKRKDDDDPSMGRLLMAVPEGSTAKQVRKIQRVLWTHPRVQRWWKRKCRELESSKSLLFSDEEIAAYQRKQQKEEEKASRENQQAVHHRRIEYEV